MTIQETPLAPAEMNLARHCPLVACGQKVKRGERIATAAGPGRGDVHAPCAGTVEHVDPYRIRIAREEGATVVPEVLDGLSGPELLARLRELGADVPACDRVDTLIINGMDEEPGLLSRRTLLAEKLDILKAGAEALVRGFVPVDVVLAVAGGVRESLPDMEVKVLSDQYPQPLDPLVAKAVTGIEMPDNTLVVGLETVFHAGLVMDTGLPVMETMVTVGNSARLITPGTPVGEILTNDGETLQDGDRIVLGGALRGMAAASPGQGVDRLTTAVSLVRNPAPVAVDAACVGCGECVRRCPARLDPAMITSYAEFGQYAKAEAEAVDACFECGLCGFFCIARRPMLQYIRLAKRELAKAAAQSGEETPVVKPLNPFALTVSVPPHRHCGTTVRDRMLMILMAMLPAAVMAAMTFGMPAVRVMALSMAAAVLAEMACDRFMDRETDVHDLHAFTVGLSFAFLLPASAPWWLVAFGSAASIVLGKMVFGPLGGSPFCAPLIGWAICRISWPSFMDVNASMLATDLTYPLAQLKNFGLDAVQITDTRQLFLGKQLGGPGAVQIAGVLLGGMLLVMRKHISSIIPVGVIGGAALTAFLFHWLDPSIYASPAFHLLTGSTLFGAFFLATDGPSSPNRQVPMLLYGLLIGALIIIIRTYGVYPDGVPFAILLANLFTPVLERIRPKPFGRR